MANQQVLNKIHRLRIPDSIGPAQLAIAARDAEIISDRLTSRPDAMQAIIDAVLNGDQKQASRLLADLKLTEEDVRSEGGGMFWLIVIVVVLYATDAY